MTAGGSSSELVRAAGGNLVQDQVVTGVLFEDGVDAHGEPFIGNEVSFACDLPTGTYPIDGQQP